MLWKFKVIFTYMFQFITNFRKYTKKDLKKTYWLGCKV